MNDKGGMIMSFASEIKKELTSIEAEDCCKQAEIAALIKMNGMLSVSRNHYTLDVQTENAAIARRMYTLIKSLYGFPIELLVRKKMKLKKNNIYIVRLKEKVQSFLQQLGIMEDDYSYSQKVPEQYLEKSCCRKAYLRGAFLAERIYQ